RTEIPSAASSPASAPRPTRIWVGASGSPSTGVTTLIGFIHPPWLLARIDVPEIVIFCGFGSLEHHNWQNLTLSPFFRGPICRMPNGQKSKGRQQRGSADRAEGVPPAGVLLRRKEGYLS